MVIDSKGNVFEDRRKADRRKTDAKTESGDNKKDKRKGKDRRDPKNAYKP